jgi:hypothetical protein
VAFFSTAKTYFLAARLAFFSTAISSDDTGGAARSVSPRSGLSRNKGGGTGGRGPPAKDVSVHSGLEHEPITATMSGPSWGPDAFSPCVRFGEGARLNRPIRSFMLSLEERAHSTCPKSRGVRHLMETLLAAAR